MPDDLTGKTKEAPRYEFCYVNDDGQVVAARDERWKVVFLDNRGEAFGDAGGMATFGPEPMASGL